MASMHYSTYQQERGGREDRRRARDGPKNAAGQDEESISGMLTNFSKALGEYLPNL